MDTQETGCPTQNCSWRKQSKTITGAEPSGPRREVNHNGPREKHSSCDCEWTDAFQTSSAGPEPGCVPGQVWGHRFEHVDQCAWKRGLWGREPASQCKLRQLLPPSKLASQSQAKAGHPSNLAWFARRKGVLKIDLEGMILKYANHSTRKQLIIYNNPYLRIIWMLWIAACWKAYWSPPLKAVHVFIWEFYLISLLGTGATHWRVIEQVALAHTFHFHGSQL